MKIETIYVIENNKFGKTIAEWAEGKRIQVISTTHKNDELSDLVDGLVLFHENHNFSKEDHETSQVISRDNKAIHKVDINGTLAATKSSFNMWLDRNRPRQLLILGSEKVAKNTNLPVFLEGIEN